MVKYTIYHIPGEKVGCTKDLKSRKKGFENLNGSERQKCYSEDIIILEIITREFDDEESWQIAGDLERHWQKELGYGCEGDHYASSRRKLRKGSQRVTELGKNGFQAQSIGPIASRGGKRMQGKHWFTNGITNVPLYSVDEVPIGFEPGMTIKNKESRPRKRRSTRSA